MSSTAAFLASLVSILIGAALGIQEGTSKAQLSRARARLRQQLAAYAGEWAR